MWSGNIDACESPLKKKSDGGHCRLEGESNCPQVGRRNALGETDGKMEVWRFIGFPKQLGSGFAKLQHYSPRIKDLSLP